MFYKRIIFCLAFSLAQAITRRQGNQGLADFPATDLLPPPALSASFPTLRPQSPRNSPQTNLFPPFTPNDSTRSNLQAQRPQQPPQQPTNREEPALLPPIEIPPERPLTDAEIAEQVAFLQSSFVPTTGKGVGSNGSRDNIQLTLEQPQPSNQPNTFPIQTFIVDNPTPKLPQNSTQPDPKPSVKPIRFPSPSESNSQRITCPICECTSEVDYICASNGVIYLNSCSFDCATFCEAGLKKSPMEACSSSTNQV